MRIPSTYARRGGEMDSTMTPMIDVVFLLLIFFVWTANFQLVELILPSNLSVAAGSQISTPDQPPPPEADFDDVVIHIAWTGAAPAWEINDVPVGSLDEVRQRLRAIAAIKQDAPVILFPDAEVPLGDVIDVYDISRLERFEKVNFAIPDRRSEVLD